MFKSIMLKVGALGAIFHGRRHQGRHRCSPTSRDETRFGWTSMTPGEPETAGVDHTSQGTSPQDFYVVFPNIPALPANVGS
jgi:hypothetical protein